ncbi:MAG: hypothetical protein FD170_3912 [Bacteroidetes bacterium]|nr:MAG: hypothetical protein FD170_3912 [Bacteroidota bacterium]
MGRNIKVGGVLVGCLLLRFGRNIKVSPAHIKVEKYFQTPAKRHLASLSSPAKEAGQALWSVVMPLLTSLNL